MRPEEPKVLIKQYAEQCGIPEKDMAAMVNFYYREIVRAASHCEHPRILIHGLGYMKFKRWMPGLLERERYPMKRIYDQLAEDRLIKIDATRRKKVNEFAEKTLKDKEWKKETGYSKKHWEKVKKERDKYR